MKSALAEPVKKKSEKTVKFGLSTDLFYLTTDSKKRQKRTLIHHQGFTPQGLEYEPDYISQCVLVWGRPLRRLRVFRLSHYVSLSQKISVRRGLPERGNL